MIRRLRILPLLLFVFSCSSRKTTIASLPESVGFDLVAMGTVWNLKIASTEFSETTWWPIKEESQKILENYDRVFSGWRKDSEATRLGRHPLKTFDDRKLLKVSNLMMEGLDFAASAYEMTHGVFDVRSSRGLDFGGITKGHVLAELAFLFLKNDIRDFSINGGGGNSVTAGSFRPALKRELSSQALVFRSASRGLQGDKQHIFDRRNPSRKIEGQVTLYCWSELNKNYRESSTQADVRQTKLVGSLSDAFSTALLIDRKNWALPNFCQELTETELKFF